MKSAMITIVLLVAIDAHADDLNFARLEEGSNVASLTMGAEHGLVVGAGYDHVLALSGHPIVVGGELTMAGAEMDVHDIKLRAGAAVPIVGRGAWKVIGGAAAVVRTTNNEVADMVDVGSDVSIVAGRYSRRWFVAGELGFDWAIATHITNSDTYRMVAFPDARDGWYGNPGGLLRFGIQSGVSFGGNDIVLRAGMMRDIDGKPTMIPIYATLAYDRRW